MPDLEKIKIFGQQAPLDMGFIPSFGYFDLTPLPDDFDPDIVGGSMLLLVEQFENSIDLQDFFSLLLAPAQEIEFTLAQLQKVRAISTAFDDQLDVAGEIVGEDRNFRTDEEYRIAIYERILLNSSSGEPETLILAVGLFTQATLIHYREDHPAAAVLTFTTAFPLPANLQTQIETLAVAGVRIVLQFIDETGLDFAYSGEGGLPDLPNTSGYSELGYTEGGETIGGRYVELISS